MARVSWTTVVGGVTLLVTAFLFYHTFDPAYDVSILTAGRGPVFFPRILLGFMFVLSAVVLVEGRFEAPRAITRHQALLVGATLAVTGLYIWGITAAGFLISTVAYVFVLPWLLGYRNAVAIVLVTALYPVGVWYVFQKVFLIILPSSPWFDSF
ncbi:MAG: tripartite tricarboxylate transporter TctB family protein [Hyphomicrobiales bacterium]|nr:tripartite tricarboxylate transporter TctB family protein [Hyphomicrobiales bacterium]MCP5373411.1 tripartite tricarboxylate transporter TctB family protein [Hyphomicrobiales bacterium]